MSIPLIGSYALPGAAELPENRVNWRVEPHRAVLLVHDMQDYFLRFYGADSALLQSLVANIAALRRWAGEQGVPVVYTAQPAVQSVRDRALLTDMWGPGLTTADPATQRITAALAPGKADTVLVKWRYSAFQRSPLEKMMQDWGRDQLLITGVYAHIGCMTTALDAFMRDIEPFMVADALADFSADDHRMALKYVAGRCGAVTTSAALVARPSLSWLHAALVPHLEQADIDPDDNLMDYGLDSLQVMEFVAAWDRLGVRVSFEELAATPTLNAWWALFERRLAA